MTVSSDPGTIAVIRIRGLPDIRPDITLTLDMLHLQRKFRATVVPDSPAYRGMLRKVKDYATYGELDKKTLQMLFSKKGELRSGGKLTDRWLTENTQFKNTEELVKSIFEGNARFHALAWLKPYFRLRPPKKGFKKATKRPWSDGGELGYRGKAICNLLRRMA